MSFRRRALDDAVERLQGARPVAGRACPLRAARRSLRAKPRGCSSIRFSTSAARGIPPSADASLARIAVVSADHAVANFALEFLPESFVTNDLPAVKRQHERAIAAGLASGAAEVQLDIVAASHLQLPRA